jgi:hypothetical protein
VSVTQLKNSFTYVGELDASIPPSSLMLQLSVTSKAIQYCIQSLAHNQIMFFGEYRLHHVENDSDLVRRLDKIYQTDGVMQLRFGKVIAGVDGDYSLVPSGLEFHSPANGGISFKQKLEPLGLELHFSIDYALNYKLKSLFPDVTVQHLAASFLGSSLQAKSNNGEQLFMDISGSHFDMVRFQASGQLQLMNRYIYKSDSDMLYFLLLCCEKLQLDRETVHLILSGEIEEQSTAYDLIYNYFRNVSFNEPGSELQFSKSFDDVSRHVHLNLYNLGSV